MSKPQSWRGVAYNQATASENRIHSDDVARQYGFRGGLVPGVTVYAYLVQPAIEAWGLPWLERGTATVRLEKPLYEGSTFEVGIEAAGETGYEGAVRDPDGVVCATGRVALSGATATGSARARRGDPPAPPAEKRPEASRAALESLRRSGLGALSLAWNGTGELDRTSRDLADIPDLVRPDRGGFANPAFTLGLANWVLSANVRLGPWIHVESDARHHGPIPNGTPLVVEASVSDLFDKGGHEFVDLDVTAYGDGDRPVLTVRHRAIYVLRPRA